MKIWKEKTEFYETKFFYENRAEFFETAEMFSTNTKLLFHDWLQAQYVTLPN
jgi:hypothetical protein